jgi:hypothetical protein
MSDFAGLLVTHAAVSGREVRLFHDLLEALGIVALFQFAAENPLFALGAVAGIFAAFFVMTR